MKTEVNEILKKLTIKEKLSLLSGNNFWQTKPIKRINFDAITVSDGPHGLRKQSNKQDNVGFNQSEKATCFPTGSALASSFDPKLIYKVGASLAKECKDQKVDIILGPAVNIKRSPLCGRNFEYYSEDPFLTGKIAIEFIKGLQNSGVGTSIKHFAVNSQEKRRLISNSCLDERTFHEIYLKAFEMAVKEAKPWTIMASYNLINGVYACENPLLLKEILRDNWRYDGLVVSDWGALNNEVASFKNGLNLEMPGVDKTRSKRLYKAYKKGLITEEEINQAITPIILLHEKVIEGRKEKLTCDYDENYQIARTVANNCSILFKNEQNILPLKGLDKILFVGGFINNVRYQGGGSSNINPYKLDNLKDVLKEANLNYEIAEGYHIDDEIDDNDLIKEALEKAAKVDKIVFIGGLPLAFESEGYDRSSMRLPKNQEGLFNKLFEINSNIIFIIEGGSPIESLILDEAKGILLQYLSGEATAGSLVDLLKGKTNPSGRLSETWPLKEKDNPIYGRYPEDNYNVKYTEGSYIGYKYYTYNHIPVRYPFGYGLSYTTFNYHNIVLSDDQKKIGIDITNDGDLMGNEVIMLFVSAYNDKGKYQSLKDFQKVNLFPHETKHLVFTIDNKYFEFYDTENKQFVIGKGTFEVSLNKNANEEIKHWQIVVEGEKPYTLPDYPINIKNEILLNNNKPHHYDYNSTIEDLNSCKMGRFINRLVIKIAEKYKKKNPGIDELVNSVLKESPLRIMVMATNGKFSYRRLDGLLTMLNGRFFKGLFILL